MSSDECYQDEYLEWNAKAQFTLSRLALDVERRGITFESSSTEFFVPRVGDN